MDGDPRQHGQPAQRVRIGVTGLAVVFLLVLLATAIVRSGSHAPASPPTNAAKPAEPNEPLAEIGVAPGQSARVDNAAAAARR